ncbi:MAG: transporter, partial [Gemmatimonadales bacterium]|nr:transporter [Gemmatimonadales bacterium]
MLFSFPARRLAAQGDGPRVFPLAPANISVVSGTYMHLASNFNFQQDILILGADISSDVGALALVHNFSVAGRFAQAQVVGIFGGIDGSGTVQQGDQPPFTLNASESGFGDPMLWFRLGLVGAPALTLAEYATHVPDFQLYGLLTANVPIGSYESSRPLNLGTNRWAIRVGAPMVFPLLDPKHPLLLEVVPSIFFYTTNTDPFRANARSQAPRLVLETHASYNLTPRLWVGGDVRYQWGAETTTDGVADDNRTSHGGLGAEVGYQFHPAFSLIAGYGAIVVNPDEAKGTMLRLR